MIPCLLALLPALAREGARDAITGWYELEPGRRVLVTYGADGGLRLFDFERPSFDVLVGDGQGFQWQRQKDGGGRRASASCATRSGE